MNEKFLEQKYFIGDNFDVPMGLDKNDIPTIYEKGGTEKKISVGYFFDKVLKGGATERVTQEKWDKEMKKRGHKK